MDATNVQAGSRPVRAFSGARRWISTAVASIATAYALDFIATVAGLAVVASGLLAGIDHGAALLLLLASYIAWGAGLWGVLKANWDLLQRTGVCTNLLAKAGNDLAVRLGWSQRSRRVTTYAGNVATELAKEAPYYIGAGGVALFSNSVNAIDAIVFLAGANLGAAVYGFALAHGLRVFLARLAKGGVYASFDTEWDPDAYLKEYYGAVAPDERETIAFFVEAMKDVDRTEPVLVFGVGPTLHHVFLAVEKASEIHLGEYLPANRHEVERWLARDAKAHDWRPFVRYTLECEGLDEPAPEEIALREEMTRARITRLLHVDLRNENPLGIDGTRQYATVISAYCADSATGSKAEWTTYMERIADLVQPDGMLLVAALRGSRGYMVDGKTFPSPDIGETDLQAVLEPRFGRGGLTLKVCRLDGPASKGYSGIVLACARNPVPRNIVALRGSATPPLPALSWVRSARSRGTLTPADTQCGMHPGAQGAIRPPLPWLPSTPAAGSCAAAGSAAARPASPT